MVYTVGDVPIPLLVAWLLRTLVVSIPQFGSVSSSSTESGDLMNDESMTERPMSYIYSVDRCLI